MNPPKVSAYTHREAFYALKELRLFWTRKDAPKEFNREMRALEKWHREQAKKLEK